MPIAKKSPGNGGNFKKKLKKITDFDKLSPNDTKSVTFLTKQRLIQKGQRTGKPDRLIANEKGREMLPAGRGLELF